MSLAGTNAPIRVGPGVATHEVLAGLWHPIDRCDRKLGVYCCTCVCRYVKIGMQVER